MLKRNICATRAGLCRAVLIACCLSLCAPPSYAVSASRARAVVLVRQAESAFYAGSYQRAVALCRQASRIDPNYARAYTWLGASYEKQRAPQSAQVAYQRVLALSPDSPDARHARLRLRRMGIAPGAAEGDAGADTAALRPPWQFVVNGRTVNTDAEPVVRDGRVLVPLRALFEALEAEVRYDQALKTIVARREARHITLTMGASQALVNGQPLNVEPPPQIIGGQTMVPLRFVAEALGAGVRWNGQSAVAISLPSNQPLIAAAPPTLPSPATRISPPESTQKTTPSPSNGATPNDATFNNAAPPTAASPVQPDIRSAPIEEPVQIPATPNSVEPSQETPSQTPMLQAPLNEVSAGEMLMSGRLRAAPEDSRVMGRPFARMYELSEQDADLVFRLDNQWDWFETQVAVADNAPSAIAEIAGWLNDTPSRQAFKDLRLRAKSVPVTLRIPITGATRLTLAPVFPGYPVLIINPRLIRNP